MCAKTDRFAWNDGPMWQLPREADLCFRTQSFTWMEGVELMPPVEDSSSDKPTDGVYEIPSRIKTEPLSPVFCGNMTRYCGPEP